MTTSNVNGHHAQVQFESLQIKSKAATFDLIESKSNMFVTLSIYTSLFSPLLRMTLIINDYYDIIKGMKLKGNEDVFVRFKYAEEEKYTELSLKLNSIVDGNRRTDQKSGQLILDCVSSDYLNFYINVSKKLTGTSNEIINSLLSDVVTTNLDLNFEEGENDLNLQTNYKSVLDIINLICKNDNKYFYQDLDGYYTKSLEGMLSSGTKETIFFLVDSKQWIYSDVVKSYGFEYWNNEVLLTKNSIHPHYINLDNENYIINEIDKGFSEIGNSNYFNDLEENKHIDSIYGNLENKMDRHISAYNLNSNTISIKLNGYENRRIGDKVILDYKGRDEIDKNHEMYHGEWIIVAIRNEIAISDYVQTIKLAKVKYTND